MRFSWPKEPTQPSVPRLLYSTEDGTILEHPFLLAAGDGGGDVMTLADTETIALPRGSDLFMLPGRQPLGIDPETGDEIVLTADEDGRPIHAVAAFLAPAHTATLLAAYETRRGAPTLPLFSYAAVGYAEDGYRVAALRVDEDPRQDPWRFDPEAIEASVRAELAQAGDNRLLQQLQRCALEYQCRAAQNFFLHRWEAPLPTSVACNSRCLGCISLQSDGQFTAAHDRLREPPRPEDVAAVALGHIGRVPDGVVSFGQGCEGEPLLMRRVLTEAVHLIRSETGRGTINLNTNASLPDVVGELVECGLDSMRVSLNSVQEPLYNAYYRPRGYRFADVIESMQRIRGADRFLSLNLLYLPGVTDRDEELGALIRLFDEVGLDMIQLRNLNVDPEFYRRHLPSARIGPGMGLLRFGLALQEHFPRLHFGYFNPPKEAYLRWRQGDGA